jgi:hypothetical protein
MAPAATQAQVMMPAVRRRSQVLRKQSTPPGTTRQPGTIVPSAARSPRSAGADVAAFAVRQT